MTTVAEAFVTLRPDTKGFTQEAQTGVGASMKKIAGGIGAAFAAVKVKDFLGDAIGEARESNRVAAQTAQVIKSTGGVANLTAGDFDKLASSISKKVGVDDEAIQSAENLLATFTNVRNETGKGNDVFNQATQAIVDMSAVQGDLQGNSILVGKALQDPIKGVTALQRVGVKLSDQQKQQVKDFVAAGDAASAQKVILKELGVEFGGQAAAQATSSAKLKVAWENLEESLGKKLVPVLEKVSSFLADHQELIAPLAVLIGGVLVAAFIAWAASAAAAAAATLAAIWPVLAIGAAITALVVLVVKNWDTIKTATIAAFDAVKGAVETAFNWIRDNWPLLLAILTGPFGLAVLAITKNFDSIVSFISGLPGRIARAAVGMFDGIKNAFRSAINFIIRGWNSLQFKLPGFKVGPVHFGGFTLGVPDIKPLAAGGIVTRPTLALIGEAGPEAVIPLTGRRAAGPSFSIGEMHVHTADDPQRIRVSVNQSLRDAAWQMGFG